MLLPGQGYRVTEDWRVGVTREQREIIDTIKATFKQMCWDGGARCRLCEKWFAGNSFGEILGKLGEHGEKEHPEVFQPS